MFVAAPPPPALAAWVDTIWMRSGPATAPVPVLPDGAADLILDLTGTPTALSDAFAVGTMTAARLYDSGARELLGIRFRPGRASALFRVPMREITDLHVPMHDLGPVAQDLAARVAEASTFQARLSVIAGALAKPLREAPKPDARLDAAIGWIVRGGGRVPIERIAAEAGITRQQLGRKFLDELGISPKAFARVMRFQRLLAAIEQRRVVTWADAAVEHGWYDQSHMIADFRELAGTTPDQFQISYR